MRWVLADQAGFSVISHSSLFLFRPAFFICYRLSDLSGPATVTRL